MSTDQQLPLSGLKELLSLLRPTIGTSVTMERVGDGKIQITTSPPASTSSSESQPLPSFVQCVATVAPHQTAPSQPEDEFVNKKRKLDDTYNEFVALCMKEIDDAKEQEKRNKADEIESKSVDLEDPRIAKLCDLMSDAVKEDIEDALNITNSGGVHFPIPLEYSYMKILVSASIKLAKLNICVVSNRSSWDVQLFYIKPKK